MLKQKKIRITAVELIEVAIRELNDGLFDNAIKHDKLAVEISINGDGTTYMDADNPVMELINQIRATVRSLPTVARMWE